MCQIKPYPWRRNYSLLARYSLKFTRHSLLIVKSLVARCKIPLLLVACCKVCSLLVAEVARCKKIVTRRDICSLLIAGVARSNKSLVSRFKIHWILLAKNHSLLKESPAGIIVCLKSKKLGESFSFFIIICFFKAKKFKVKNSATVCSKLKK